MEPTISVITPIYNVKQFVHKCVESLMSQTFEDVEYIFVNDASNDGSIDIVRTIIEKYPTKNAKIINHQENRGLPASRKTGFEAANGKYIFNCDGDDWVESTLLEKLYNAIKTYNADYSYCDFFLSYEKTERYMKCPAFTTPDEALRKGYLSGAAKYNVWNKLIKKDLYEGVVFPVDHKRGGEDMIMLGILSKAKSIAYVPEALYHYLKINTSAISEVFSHQRIIDIKHNADTAISVLRDSYHEDIEKEIAFFKLNVKLPFIITDDPIKYQVWKEWYPEANKHIFENKHQSVRNRIVQYLAAKGIFWAVRFYYRFTYKFVYRLIYK
ncbi:MAG: glycosyltransferase family 2 protein [Bacteroidaceae bacterium]|nr:glycosyltransferase family 2 protein [Bacteroidaceae bacterium]